MSAPAQPLAGIGVVDVTTSVAGPYCTAVLGALGAEVVKIERPGGGDDTRAWGPPFWNGESAMYLAMNPNKRSLVVDLKAAAGRRIVERLVASADVFIQNLRPGLAGRLGLGFEELREHNDRLIYCTLGAYGPRGPLAELSGYDPLMQAAGGIMSITGEPGGLPVRSGASIVDQGTGMWAVIAILAALRERDAGGAFAQHVETSLYETAVNLIPYQLVGYLASGIAPRRFGSGVSILAPYEAFRSSDGWVMIAAGNDRIFERLCDALELPALRADPRFATNSGRVEGRAELTRLIAEAVATRATAEWLGRLAAAGVPAAPVLDVGEVAAHEQTEALGLRQALPSDAIPELELVALPISLDGRRSMHRTPPPRAGEHTGAVLAQAGYSREEIERLVADGVVERALG